MSINTDYHLHTSFSDDSDASMESMIQFGIQKGLKTMCFTEHMDYDYPFDASHPDMKFLVDTDAYFLATEKYAAAYQKDCLVLHGIELGLQTTVTALNKALVDKYAFDFVIGSCHLLDGIDPYYPAYFENKSESQVYKRYFECFYENLLSFSDIDALGHLDYIVRYGPNKNQFYNYNEYKPYIDPILHFLIQHDIALEVNTGSFKYGMNVTNPCPEIIRAYHDFGGKLITVGSDAHAPKFIANQFQTVEKILKKCGFTHYSVYQNRIPEFVLL